VNNLLLRLEAANLRKRVIVIGQHEEPVQNRYREPHSEGNDDDDGSEDQQEVALALIIHFHLPKVLQIEWEGSHQEKPNVFWARAGFPGIRWQGRSRQRLDGPGAKSGQGIGGRLRKSVIVGFPRNTTFASALFQRRTAPNPGN
jgi:hypothetical protein